MKIRNLYISPGHNFFGHHEQAPGQHPVIEVPEIECLASQGVSGDRFFAFRKNYKGQITFFAAEVYEVLCHALGVYDKPASVFRRNVLTEDADLNSLIGSEFEVQGIRFHGVEECAPCHWMNGAFAPGAETLMKGRGGLRARILTDGHLRVQSK